MSANINVSNVIAAVFTATGQDIASTIESSASLFHMIPYKKRTQALSEDFTPAGQAAVLDVMDREGGVYAALSLPSILAGTVGGGTGLATQKECLEIMNCYGKVRTAIFGNVWCEMWVLIVMQLNSTKYKSNEH